MMKILSLIILITGILASCYGVLTGDLPFVLLSLAFFVVLGGIGWFQVDHLRKRADALFESTADGMIEVARTGEIIRVNEQARKIFGYEIDELVGMNVDGLVPDSFQEGHGQFRLNYFAHPQPRYMGSRGVKLFARKKNGQTFPVEIGLTFLKVGGQESVIAGVRDITDRINMEKQARIDHLTGLRNRMTCEEILKKEVRRNKRYGYPFSVILCDIDHFKRVNDTYGHNVGDDVLVAFAHILNTTVREVDINGRWGGEEFLIICPDSNADHGVHLAERVRRAVASFDFNPVEQLTSSFGVAAFEQNDSIETLIQRADEALYAAKENGRNQVVCDQ